METRMKAGSWRERAQTLKIQTHLIKVRYIIMRLKES